MASRLGLGTKTSFDGGQQVLESNDETRGVEAAQDLAILEARALANAAQAHVKQAQFSQALMLQRRCLEHLRAQVCTRFF